MRGTAVRIARVALDGCARWAAVEGDDAADLRIRPLETTPFDASPRPTRDEYPLSSVPLLAPVTPSKIFAVGRNYEAHRIEMGLAPATVPAVLMKPPSSVIGPGQDVVMPAPTLSSEVGFEAELAIVIGIPARNLSPSGALDAVLGFTCADDVCARDLQRSDPQPTRAKGFDSFCPVGPWIETDLDLAGGLRIGSRVNGVLRQDSSTSGMTFGVAALVSFLSGFTTLLPGDLILTGSPPGSGLLHAGDQVEIFIEGIGVLRHGVKLASPTD